MLNSGKKFVLCATKKNNILTLVLFEKKILNETKNHNPPPPPPLQVKWSVPYARGGLSAILFSLYVNEFEMEFLCNGNVLMKYKSYHCLFLCTPMT